MPEFVAFATKTFEYMEEKISLEDWLQEFNSMLGADYSASERWSSHQPDSCLTSSVGTGDPLRTGWRNWAEHVMSEMREHEPFYLDISTSGKRMPVPLADKVKASEVIVYALDWNPARIVGVVRKTGGDGEWNARTRKLLDLIIPYLREAVEMHKVYGRSQHLSCATGDILDSAPRGILALAPNGTIRYSNAFAEGIMADNDGLSRKDKRFHIGQDKQRAKFEERLALVKTCPKHELNTANWALAIERPSGRAPYQMIVRPQPMRAWRIETARHDRIAVVYLHDPEYSQRPTFEQLKNFYGFTTAEAKLAALLLNGMSITDASDHLGVSVNTSRTHIRNIFSKVGVKTQAELLGKLTSTLKIDKYNKTLKQGFYDS